MTDLHTRLHSAIEERLALAQAATQGPWTMGIVAYTIIDAAARRTIVSTRYETDAEFIAANSPDGVIRACRADLARLERHVGIFDNVAERLGIELPPEHAFVCTADGESWPCPEVRLMAEVWLEV